MTEPDRRRLVAGLGLGLFALWLVAPIVAALASAATPSTLAALAAAAGDDHPWRALGAVLLVGVAVAAVAVPLGLAGALALRRLSRPAAGRLFVVLAIPIVLPGLVTGRATAALWHELGLGDGLLLVALARTATAAGLAMVVFLVRLDGFDPVLEDAARDLGASPALVMRRLLLPRLAPAAGVAAILAFLVAIHDPDAALFALGGTAAPAPAIAERLATGAAAAADGFAAVSTGVVVATVAGWLAWRRRAG